jgi:hypothetical protein
MIDLGKWFYRFLAIVLINPDLSTWGFVYYCYVGFNAFEAIAWFAFSLFVGIRFALHRQTWYEILYALSFLVFGVSDVMEMYQTTFGLLIAKGIILMSIIAGRKVALGYYPGAKY